MPLLLLSDLGKFWLVLRQFLVDDLAVRVQVELAKVADLQLAVLGRIRNGEVVFGLQVALWK